MEALIFTQKSILRTVITQKSMFFLFYRNKACQVFFSVKQKKSDQS